MTGNQWTCHRCLFDMQYKKSRRTERLHSPACGIFVFEGLANQLAKTERVAFDTEKMPPFCMGSFCRFYIQGFTFQVACEPLIIYGKRNDSVYITLSKCQCKWFRRLKAVFLEIPEVQSVS